MCGIAGALYLRPINMFDIEQVRAMQGVHGVHIMAYRQEETVAEIVERAGLLNRHGAVELPRFDRKKMAPGFGD